MTELRKADLTDVRGLPWEATIFTDPDADDGTFLKLKLEPVFGADRLDPDLPVTFAFGPFLMALAPMGVDLSRFDI